MVTQPIPYESIYRSYFRKSVAGSTPNQEAYNKTMNQVRAFVEWIFGDIIKYFTFFDYKKDLRTGLSAVGKMYITCVVMSNAHTYLCSSTTVTFFELQPPSVDSYFL